jgi:GT2 family glycosyltransferase
VISGKPSSKAIHSSVKQEGFQPISIIILTFNGSQYIHALIDSLLNQSYPSELVEIIVVDNASSDDTLLKVRNKYPSVKTIGLDRNLGFAGGNNIGLKHASHDFLVFLNQDTICHRHWLKGIVTALGNCFEIAACASNVIMPGTKEFEEKEMDKLIPHVYFYDLTCFGYAKYRRVDGPMLVPTKLLSGCSFGIRREIVDSLGGLFDEDILLYAEDTDLSLRIHNIGKKIVVARDSMVYHLHNTSARINWTRLNIAAKAIVNRVCVFYKNMTTKEFLVFFPFLLLGGILKIFTFPIKLIYKAIYFLPFALFSIACMVYAFFQLPKFSQKRRGILERRANGSFVILKMLLKCNIFS